MVNPFEAPATGADSGSVCQWNCRAIAASTGPTLGLFLILVLFRPLDRVNGLEFIVLGIAVACVAFSAFVNRQTAIVTKVLCSGSICIVWFCCGLLEDWANIPPAWYILRNGCILLIVHFAVLVMLGSVFGKFSRSSGGSPSAGPD